jgi:osmotically-inducible protein OsmY
VDHKADPNKLHKSVKYAVKNAAVTLTGEVNTQAQRAMAEKVASQVPQREAGGE